MRIHLPPSLRHDKFTLLWLGLMVSVAGSQMQIWALFWHIRELTTEPIALGGIGLARILPIFVFSLIGGAIADVANRRVVMLFTQTTMALVALGLALLTFAGKISLWHIYLLTAVQAFALAFDGPARQSLVPNLVPARDLPNAFSMTSIAGEVGSIVGPALSGVVIAYMGLGYTYLFNAISYGAVILAVIAMGSVPQERRVQMRTGVSWGSIREGVQFIASQPMILSTMILDFFATFFSSANTLMPIYARDILKVGAIQYGWLSAGQSIGAVIAALTISQLHSIRRQGPVFLGAVIVFGSATVLFGFSRVFLLSMLGLMLMGAADSVSTIIRNTIRQLLTPDYIRGRMTSVNQIFFMGGPQLGEVEAGVVAQIFNTPFAIVSGGIGCIVAVLLIIRRWPQVARFDNAEMSAGEDAKTRGRGDTVIQ